MAFLPPSARLPTSNKKKAISQKPSSKTYPRATTTAPGPSSRRVHQSTTKPHKKRSAHVVDTRVASRIEAHHWIIVKNHSMRIFERAAVAQADVARQIESRKGSGALHRWVLRQVADPTQPALAVQGRDGRYVVMEAFHRAQAADEQPLMRRWLSAVERVGPLMNTVDIRTLQYENLFTSKLHDAKFDPNNNIVVVESVNVDMSKSGNLDRAVDVLRMAAERNVSSGDCLEFCVLHAPGEAGFFKTIEVYKDIDALTKHMDGRDKFYAKKLEGYTIQGQRGRQTFKPVVFA